MYINELIHCHKCKKKTENLDAKIVQMANGLYRIASKCSKCKTNKSKIIKNPYLKDIVKKELKKEDQIIEAKEIHSPVRKKFIKRKIITLGIDDLWAADLILMSIYEKENDGFKYMLNVIDTFSKYVWSKPLKKKNGIEVSKAFEEIIKDSIKIGHKPPNLLHTDKGLEFKNKEFSAIMKKYNIKLYHTENEEKSSIIERYNRTQNEKMKVQFEINKNFKWIDILQKIVKEYNNSYHSTIKMKPIEVNKSNEKELLNTVFKYVPPKIVEKSKFVINDKVRIANKKNTFSNKYMNNWSREIFVVSRINNTNPVTYNIKDLNNEDIIGSFYDYELKKTLL